MAQTILVPANWAARIPGQSGAFYVSIPNAKTFAEAASTLAANLTDYGVPAAAVQGWSKVSGSRPGASTVGDITRKASLDRSKSSYPGQGAVETVKGWFGGQKKGEIKDGVFKPFSAEDSPGIDWGAGRGEESSTTGVSQYQNNSRFTNKPVDPETLRRLRAIGRKAAAGKRDQFLTDAQKAQRVTQFDPNSPMSGRFDDFGNEIQTRTEKTTGIGKDSVEPFNPNAPFADPNFVRNLYPQQEAGMEGTGIDLNPEQKFLFDSFDPRGGIGNSVRTEIAPDLGLGESVDVNQIINLFTPGGRFGDAITVVEGIETLNPLLEVLLDTADLQNERVSLEQVADLEARSREQVAIFNKDAAIEVARQNGLSNAEVARITTEADATIATARGEVEKYIAEQQLTGVEAQAGATEAAAESARMGTEAAAESARLGVEAASKDARIADQFAASSGLAGQRAAASAASPFGFMNQGGSQADLAAIYNELNEVGLAQAAAAQNNPYAYAASQTNPETGKREFRPNELAQIGANTPAAFAARGQEAAARAGATGFGALLSGDAMQQGNANAILRAQAANNAYAAQQLGQDEARIDQILRGGLSAEQRLAEINASQAGQNFANQLNFMSNPSAVGFATETGLLNDISNSPEGNIPGSLFGFNSPSAAGAGGNQTTNTGNFNANTLRNASDEQIGFLQGAASAGGQTPSEFNQQVESFTPQGY